MDYGFRPDAFVSFVNSVFKFCVCVAVDPFQLHDNDSGHVEAIARTVYHGKDITDVADLQELLCIQHGARNQEGRHPPPQEYRHQEEEYAASAFGFMGWGGLFIYYLAVNCFLLLRQGPWKLVPEDL